MIRPDHPDLSIVRQCRLVSISRSGYYHKAQGESLENPAGESVDGPLRLDFDRRQKLEFHGSR